MGTPISRDILRPSLAVSGALLLLAGCAAPAPERVGGERGLEPVSAELTGVIIDVTAALLREPSVDAAAIRVVLDGDTVVLDGFVADAAEADRAAALAREAVPDRAVVSALTVP